MFFRTLSHRARSCIGSNTPHLVKGRSHYACAGLYNGESMELTIDITRLGCVCQEYEWGRKLSRLACPVDGRLASSKCFNLHVTAVTLSTQSKACTSLCSAPSEEA